MRIAMLGLSLALVACSQTPAPENPEPDWDDEQVEDADQAEADEDDLQPARARPPAIGLMTPMPSYPRETRRVRYRGSKIDLDVRDADLHNVFRLIGDVGGINIVVGDGVQGKITLRLRQVPWDQALHVIVRAKRLSLTIDDGLYLITAQPPGE